MKSLNLNRLFPLFLLIAVSGVNSCNEPPADDISDPVATSTFVSKSQFDDANMTVGTIEKRNFSQVIHTYGTLDVPPENRASVSVYFEGYVKDISLLPGDVIKKGAILFTLENPDFVKIQQEFLEVRGRLSFLESDYQRQKSLVQEQVTSKKNFLKAESDYNVAKATYEGLKKTLKLMNIDPEALKTSSLQTEIKVRAPIGGYVTKVGVTKGMFVNPSDEAVSIVDTDHMHLELTVFEKYLAQIQVGQPITFSLEESDEKYKGAVHLINKMVDPESRTITVHGHLEEEDASLIPGMYVEADIHTSVESKFSLPEEAIVNLGTKSFALALDKQTPQGYTFTKQEVQTGTESEGFVEIINPGPLLDQFFLTTSAFTLIQE